MKVGDNVVVIEENWVHNYKLGQKGIVHGFTQDGLVIVRCPVLDVIQLMKPWEVAVE